MRPIEKRIATRRLIRFCQLVLGAVFLYAGFGKITDPQAFAEQVAAYRLTPDLLTNLLAAFLPVLEIVCGLCLILGRWALGASAITAALLAMFLFAIASAMVRGLDIDCGCFSVSGGHRVSLWRLVEDAILLVAALVSLQGARLSDGVPPDPQNGGETTLPHDS